MNSMNVITSSVIYDGENNNEISKWNQKPNRERNVQVSEPEKSGQATTMLEIVRQAHYQCW